MTLPPGFVTLGACTPCPARIVVTANASETSSAKRLTIDREQQESEAAFWARVVSTAHDIAAPLLAANRFRHAPGGLISFVYAPLTTLDEAEADDGRFNVTQAFLYSAKHDPSQRVRVWALRRLAEMHVYLDSEAC